MIYLVIGIKENNQVLPLYSTTSLDNAKRTFNNVMFEKEARGLIDVKLLGELSND